MKNVIIEQGAYKGILTGWYWLQLKIDGEITNFFKFQNEKDFKIKLEEIKIQYENVFLIGSL